MIRSCSPSAILNLQQRLSACIDEVHSWIQSKSNRLQLNTNKSELLWCATTHRQHPTMSIQDRAWYHHSVIGCARSWYLYWFWSQHADACLAVCRRLLFSVKSAAQHSSRCSVVRRLCISRWLMPLYYHGLITATRHWLASWPACLTVSSLSSTRQLGRSLVFVARSTLQMLSPVFTGCGHPSAPSSNWQSLSTELFTTLHQWYFNFRIN